MDSRLSMRLRHLSVANASYLSARATTSGVMAASRDLRSSVGDPDEFFVLVRMFAFHLLANRKLSRVPALNNQVAHVLDLHSRHIGSLANVSANLTRGSDVVPALWFATCLRNASGHFAPRF